MSGSFGGNMAARATKKSASIYDQLAADIMQESRSSHPASSSPYSRDIPEEVHLFKQPDYAQPLRRALGRSEVRQIVAEARRVVWPRLNEAQVEVVSPTEFTRRWSGLGVQFRLAKLSGAEGLALLGFYVRKMGRSRLPLICVNTSHHPAAIGATFSHEMGHHLVGQIFDTRKEHAQLLTSTAYGAHLEEPEELAADVLVSLGVFPKEVARQIFMKRQAKRPSKVAEELSEEATAKVFRYFQSRFGLSFDGPLPSAKKLQYMAAVLHFSKLRCALLTEYDI